MRHLQKFAGTVFALAFIQNAFADENPVFIQFVRPLGMGGAFTAVADDQNVFSYNPAGMVQRTGAQVTLLEIAAGGAEDAKDALDFVKDNEDDLTNLDNVSDERKAELINEIDTEISKLNPRIYVGADIASYVSGPKFLGIPIHAGFGAFGSVDASFKIESAGHPSPTISFAVNNDIMFPLSLAKRWNAPLIPGKIGIGVTGKYLQRNQMREQDIPIVTLDELETPPLQKGRGIGADLGGLYQPTDRFNFGFMIQDIGGTKMKFDEVAAENGYSARAERESVIRPHTNFGVAMTPKKLLWLVPTNDRWLFAFDVRDMFDPDDHVMFQNGFKKVFGENFGTHAYLGAEFRYWFLRFRGGAFQGYPSFGLGLDIPILKLDYAFFSRELGEQAGDKQERNHVVSLALRFGSGNTESRERIKKSKEARKIKKEAMPDEAAPAAPAAEPASAAPDQTPE